MKLGLVNDARKAWRWFSMQAMSLTVVEIGAWAAMPDSMREYLPRWLGAAVAIATLFAGMVGRLVKQNDPHQHGVDHA